MSLRLDKVTVESSNPNLTAAHAGASTGKLGTCNQMLRMLQIAEGGLFCVNFPDSLPTFEYSVGVSKSGENLKPALLRKRAISRRAL